MIDQLQTNTDAATQYLLDSLKHLKVSNYDCEDITRVVSMVRGAAQRLKNLKDPRECSTRRLSQDTLGSLPNYLGHQLQYTICAHGTNITSELLHQWSFSSPSSRRDTTYYD
jgi:hypothetical protein